MFRSFIFRKRNLILLAILAGGYTFYNCLPDPLFKTPVSTVLLDRKDNLLGAYIADDGQWRFPENEKINEKAKG